MKNSSIIIHSFIYLLACWNADPKERPKISEVIKLLDKINIDDTAQNVEIVFKSEDSLDTRNSYEQMSDSSNSSTFEITSTMEKYLQN